jgi:hypothetical protein
MIRLYELKKGAKIDAAGTGELITFDHVDGMYSYCTTADGRVCHLAAYTPLTKAGDHYEIAEEKT